MADPIVIHREGNPWLEKAVRVTQGNTTFWINTRTQIGLALDGLNANRQNRIVSFADGLVDAGHLVFVNDNRVGKGPRFYQHRKAPSSTLIYYLYGRAWGSGQWNALVHQLQTTIVQSQRLAVFESTAKYYFHRPWEKEIRLQLPR